jgi:hypothetical protein
MAMLKTDLNIAAADDFYERLIATHRGLTDGESALVNAKLILLLANHIGDADVLAQAMTAAREGVGAPSEGKHWNTKGEHPEGPE